VTKTDNWPEYRGKRNRELERFILDILKGGPMTDDQITQEVQRAYNTIQEPVPWLDIDVTLFAMVSGRHIRQREAECEGEHTYSLRQKKPKSRAVQKTLMGDEQ
jgi:hypothetical protein